MPKVPMLRVLQSGGDVQVISVHFGNIPVLLPTTCTYTRCFL
jgi:hypothetical protein